MLHLSANNMFVELNVVEQIFLVQSMIFNFPYLHYVKLIICAKLGRKAFCRGFLDQSGLFLLRLSCD